MIRDELVKLAAGLIASGAVAACGGGAQEAPPPPVGYQVALAGAPSWVLQGCAGWRDASADTMCGVGSVSGTQNISLARSAAQGRARVDLSRQLESYVAALLRDYQESVTDFGAGHDEQRLMDVSRQLSESTIRGARQALKGLVDLLLPD